MPAVAEQLQPICRYVILPSPVLDYEQEAAEATEKFFSVLSGFLLLRLCARKACAGSAPPRKEQTGLTEGLGTAFPEKGVPNIGDIPVTSLVVPEGCP